MTGHVPTSPFYQDIIPKFVVNVKLCFSRYIARKTERYLLPERHLLYSKNNDIRLCEDDAFTLDKTKTWLKVWVGKILLLIRQEETFT